MSYVPLQLGDTLSYALILVHLLLVSEYISQRYSLIARCVTEPVHKAHSHILCFNYIVFGIFFSYFATLYVVKDSRTDIVFYYKVFIHNIVLYYVLTDGFPVDSDFISPSGPRTYGILRYKLPKLILGKTLTYIHLDATAKTVKFN